MKVHEITSRVQLARKKMDSSTGSENFANTLEMTKLKTATHDENIMHPENHHEKDGVANLSESYEPKGKYARMSSNSIMTTQKVNECDNTRDWELQEKTSLSLAKSSIDASCRRLALEYEQFSFDRCMTTRMYRWMRRELSNSCWRQMEVHAKSLISDAPRSMCCAPRKLLGLPRGESQFIVGTMNGRLQLCDSSTLEGVPLTYQDSEISYHNRQSTLHNGRILCVNWSPHWYGAGDTEEGDKHRGIFTASASDDGSANVWKNHEHQVATLRHPTTANYQMRFVGFSPTSSQHIITAASEGSWVLWDIDRITCEKGVEAQRPIFLQRHESPITCSDWQSDGTLVYCGNQSGNVTIWDIRCAKVVASISHSSERVLTLAAHPTDGVSLAVGGEDNLVSAWDIRQPKRFSSLLAAHSKMVTSVRFGIASEVTKQNASCNSSCISSCSFDGTVVLWDYLPNISRDYEHHEVTKGSRCSNGEILSVLSGHDSRVFACDFAYLMDSSARTSQVRLISIGSDRTCLSWETPRLTRDAHLTDALESEHGPSLQYCSRRASSTIASSYKQPVLETLTSNDSSSVVTPSKFKELSESDLLENELEEEMSSHHEH